MCVGVINSSNATRHFHGYTDHTATTKKILHNVFKKGDRVFLTGEYRMTTTSNSVNSHQQIQNYSEKCLMQLHHCYMLATENF